MQSLWGPVPVPTRICSWRRHHCGPSLQKECFLEVYLSAVRTGWGA